LSGLPPWARLLFVAALASYLAIIARGAFTTQLTGREVVTAATFTVAAILSVEVSLRLAWPRARQDRLSRDFLSVWMLPAVLLLPPPLVAAVVAVPVLYIQARVWRRNLIKVMFTIAALGLAQAGAAETHMLLSGHHANTWTLHQLAGGPTQLGAVAAAAAVSWTVNQLLIGAIVALTTDTATVFAFLRDREGAAIDATDLSMGVLVAAAWAANPTLLAFVVAPVLLMQHQVFSGLRHAVRTDLLTDVASGPYWRDTAARQIDRARAANTDVAVLLLDIDHFKTVNDDHGHLTGDMMLTAIARALQAALRPGDTIGRVGGEEFAAVMIGLTLPDAHAAAERVRRQLGAVQVRSERGDWVAVTVSIGVADCSVNGNTLTELLHAADRALYAAKAAGRNRVHTADPTQAPRSNGHPQPTGDSQRSNRN